MGEPAAACSLPPLEPPLLLAPPGPFCPQCEPLNPLLPKASLMLKCKECPKTLRFCSEAIHGQVPCGKENRNLVAIFPIMPRQNVSRHLPLCCPLLRSEAGCSRARGPCSGAGEWMCLA